MKTTKIHFPLPLHPNRLRAFRPSGPLPFIHLTFLAGNCDTSVINAARMDMLAKHLM